MSSARSPVGSAVVIFVGLGVLSAACNAVIGIEDPTENPISEAGLLVDGAPRGGSGNGQGGGRLDVIPVDASPTADISRGSGGATPDALGPMGGTGGSGAGGSGTGGSGTGGSGTGRSGGSIADAATPIDARDGGLLAAPGEAKGTCTFSDIKNANADTSLYVSTQGSAARKLVGTDEVFEISLTNFNAGVQRNLNIRMRGPVTPGQTIALDAVSSVEYYDVKTGSGWTSTAVTTGNGTLKITDAVGTSFAFTILGAKLGPTLSGVGSFTLNGSGRANPL